jgi:hypothetical protein
VEVNVDTANIDSIDLENTDDVMELHENAKSRIPSKDVTRQQDKQVENTHPRPVFDMMVQQLDDPQNDRPSLLHFLASESMNSLLAKR